MIFEKRDRALAVIRVEEFALKGHRAAALLRHREFPLSGGDLKSAQPPAVVLATELEAISALP
jgi:hypothetical protein